MKFVMFYDIAPGGLARAGENYDEHRARLNEFNARGVLLMAGPFGNPPEGAMGVFTSKDAAEEFIQADPFVINGVVSRWRIVEWNEVLS